MGNHKVTVWPMGKVIEVSEETSLLQALRDNGFLIKSSCGGVASCRDCIIRILSGESSMEPPSFAEIKLMGNVFHITKERLSCQAKVKGDVTVDISGHDQSPGGDRVTPKSFIKKKAVTILRKKETGPTENSENKGAPQKKEDPDWYKHWEKDGKVPKEADVRKKRLGGNKRPKIFRYNKNDES